MSDILFFSRGRGFGHATRDMVLGSTMELMLNAKVTYGSCSTGFEAFRMFGVPCLDLGQNDGIQLSSITRMIDSCRPRLVVTDEEIAAVAVAHGFRIPTLYVTNWLPDNHSGIELVSLADAIAFVDFPTGIDLPESLAGKTSFVGPTKTIGLQRTTRNRDEVRQTLGFLPEQQVIVVTIGGRPLDRDHELLWTIFEAVRKLGPQYRVLFVVGQLRLAYEALNGKAPGGSDISFIDLTSDLLTLCAASDLVITRGGHTTLWELAYLGIPSISIPEIEKYNPMGIRYAERMAGLGTTVCLPETALTSTHLRRSIRAICEDDAVSLAMRRSCNLTASGYGEIRVARIARELMGW